MSDDQNTHLDYLKKLSHQDTKFFVRELQPRLVAVIEEHLPRDFSRWEVENSTWSGTTKTIDGTKQNPQSSACAWSIFVCYRLSDEVMGHIQKKSNQKALEDMLKGLNLATEAASRLDGFVKYELSKHSQKRYQESVGDGFHRTIPPDFNLLLITQALRGGAEKALAFLESEGGQNKSNRQAAAVVTACRKIWEARSGKQAPKYAHSQYQGEVGGNPAASPFVCFVEDIFGVLDIDCNANSALRVMRKMRVASVKVV
ncbi:hypothetical protein [Nioella aestuarii]|uniref:hypothetical protein n=1 Tax=Nioella aestuarii TaxID=1662864 RepID=UPI003D7F202F